MRLYDVQNDRLLDEAGVYLERHEADQLASYLQQLLENPSIHHFHLNGNDPAIELTVTIYDPENLDHRIWRPS